jgi:hypothetical protein
MQSILYLFPDFKEIFFPRQIFEKYSNIKLHQNPLSGRTHMFFDYSEVLVARNLQIYKRIGNNLDSTTDTT